MDILEEFEQVKVELREKWLDYYEANHRWIKIANLHKGQCWDVPIDGVNTRLWCPSSPLILGVVSTLDKRVADSIQIAMQLSSNCGIDKIIEGLGLRFDPDIALEERRIAQEEKEEIQEAKLLSEGENDEDEDDDELGLEALRREANQNK